MEGLSRAPLPHIDTISRGLWVCFLAEVAKPPRLEGLLPLVSGVIYEFRLSSGVMYGPRLPCAGIISYSFDGEKLGYSSVWNRDAGDGFEMELEVRAAYWYCIIGLSTCGEAVIRMLAGGVKNG